MSDFVYRGEMARKRNRWLIQPGKIIYRTAWETFEEIATGAACCALLAVALVFLLRILAGG